MIFPCYIYVIILLLHAQVQEQVVVIFLIFRVREAKTKHIVPYDTSMTCNIVLSFVGHYTQPDCGSCSVDPKIRHPAKGSLAMCKHTGQVLGDFVAVFHPDIFPEDSLIGRRNYLATKTANLLSAAAGPDLSKTRNPIANLASD